MLTHYSINALLSLPVDMPPTINEPTVYNETDNVRIVCASNATPSPRGITWLRNDIVVSTTATLSFSSIQRNNASIYTCCTLRFVAGESVTTCSNFTITVQCEYLCCVSQSFTVHTYPVSTCINLFVSGMVSA